MRALSDDLLLSEPEYVSSLEAVLGGMPSDGGSEPSTDSHSPPTRLFHVVFYQPMQPVSFQLMQPMCYQVMQLPLQTTLPEGF